VLLLHLVTPSPAVAKNPGATVAAAKDELEKLVPDDAQAWTQIEARIAVGSSAGNSLRGTTGTGRTDRARRSRAGAQLAARNRAGRLQDSGFRALPRYLSQSWAGVGRGKAGASGTCKSRSVWLKALCNFSRCSLWSDV
jgi:hypothetical protein